MKEMIPYLKRFAEWAIGLRERYTSDLFFRTTLHVVTLQSLLVLFCIAAFWLSLYNPAYQWYAFGGVVLFAVIFGILLARFTLGPARDTLRYQKLFISNVAHELRTPLSIIKTSSEVALIDGGLPAAVRRTFGDIASELDRVSEIINNLLSLNTLTRPERMRFGNVALAPLVNLVVKRHTALAKERNIKLKVKWDNYQTVWGNATALEQIVANLVKNAIAYTPKGAHGVVSILIQPRGDMVLLSVQDSGIGISQEDLSHIFEPFYRADISRVRKVKKSGSGLGLTIVNEIVRVHHGKIQIQSIRRKGTTVSVYLPKGLDSSAPALRHSGIQPQNEVMLDFSLGRSSGARAMMKS
ncbi:MAG: HAMP domain-containing histidine kinase [Patescibacteria group bacterium]|nr:HAMP domain-containing histidine kinase [Patescibacteria group bacterium]